MCPPFSARGVLFLLLERRAVGQAFFRGFAFAGFNDSRFIGTENPDTSLIANHGERRDLVFVFGLGVHAILQNKSIAGTCAGDDPILEELRVFGARRRQISSSEVVEPAGKANVWIRGPIRDLGGVDLSHGVNCRCLISSHSRTQQVWNCDGGDDENEWDQGEDSVSHYEPRGGHAVALETAVAVADFRARDVAEDDGGDGGKKEEQTEDSRDHAGESFTAGFLGYGIGSGWRGNLRWRAWLR